ncbi:MAG: GNAT family N-acetyltransferase [Arthrobacter sp.]|jgi:GNAT superfamily N-acetyltransferase|nr:GNAT family N-acetyltransferase [Arthrobacter sp.]
MSETPTVRPATVYEDVAAVLGPKNPQSSVCFCLSYRLGSRENNALKGPERGERVRELCAQTPPPGVLAYLGDVPVGWAAVHPRAATAFARNRKIPHLEPDAWSLWCLRVRAGYRRRGLTAALIEGAVEQAFASGATTVEAYPVRNGEGRVDTTMAYVGTESMFAAAGFVVASPTTSVLNGFERVIMTRSRAS